MESIKQSWLRYVKTQSDKAARDPYNRAKILGMVAVLAFIFYKIPAADASAIACAPCVAWAAKFCTAAMAATGSCAAVAAAPPLLCACLLATGGGMCAVSAVTCAAVCLVPTP